ncbi:MAG: NADH-quinone oxidoreductase subunit N [Candidatus Dormibacteraceae bacterium]
MALTVLLASAAQTSIHYDPQRALRDLAQIGPIAAVSVALLAALVVDLLLPGRLRGAVVAGIAVLGLLVSLALACLLWHSGQGRLAYSGYATGDSFATFFEVLFSILGVLSVLISRPYLRARGYLESEYHVLLLAAVAGMMVLAAATSLVTVFLGLELFSVALYISCGYARRDTRSQESSVKYLMVGGFGSAFVLYGMALTYGATGSTLLSEISKRVTSGQIGDPLLILGIMLMGVGFAYKVSAAPFHMWTPDVYEGAPTPVTAFMSVGTKAAAFAMIIRVFNSGLPHLGLEWQALLAFVAAASMLVGNLMAIVQTGVKRLLAYSGVAHAGYVLIGVIAGGPFGIAAVLFYLFGYMFMNFGAFAIVSMVSGAGLERDRLSDLDGLGYRRPLLGVLMTVFMLSLAGFPPTVGFIGKFFIFQAGVSAGYTWLVVIAVMMSVVSVYYYLRVLLHVWTPVTRPHALAAGIGPLGAVAFAGVFSVLLGILPSVLLLLGQLGAHPVLAATR